MSRFAPHTLLCLVICLAISTCLSASHTGVLRGVTYDADNDNSAARHLAEVPDEEWQDAYKKINSDERDWAVVLAFKNMLGWEVGTDKMDIEFDAENQTCYIFAQDSGHFIEEWSDWGNNLFGWGSKEIQNSYYEYQETYDKCSYWCGWYPCRKCTKATRTKRKYDKGYSGFVGPYNAMESGLSNLVKNRCQDEGAKKYQYIGFSRGGALVQVAAMQHFRKGIINKGHEVKMYLYNSPNALESWSADALKPVLDVGVHIQRYAKRKRYYRGGRTELSPSVWEDPVTNTPPGYTKPTKLQKENCPGGCSTTFIHICAGRPNVNDWNPDSSKCPSDLD